jgi:hypothetical protein
MPDTTGGSGKDAARKKILRYDRLTLTDIVRERRFCEATGEPLDPRYAVAMMVRVRPGDSRLAIVSATHWDSGTGALSSADPNVDPDVLDGRKLVAPAGAGAWYPRSHGRRARETRPAQQPRPPVPGSAGVVPGVG